ncbi:MAG: outer membrane beta-barrel protein [Gemmatimonadales bacterium]
MRSIAWVARISLLSGVLMAGANPLAAQRISFAPNIGVYVPTTELVKAANGDQFKQEISLTLGGRLGIALGQRLGLEFTGAYAPSDLKVTPTGLASQSQDANIFTGSGRISLQVVPYTSPVAFVVTGGVGVINRSGDFYSNVANKTDIGGTVGASARFRLGSLLHLQVSAEDYVYKPKAEIPGFGPNDEKKTQNDIHLSFGVGIPLLGLGQMGK